MRYPYRAARYAIDGADVLAVGGADRRGTATLQVWRTTLGLVIGDHVLYLAGKTAEAERAVERAVEIYDAKGAVAMSERARRMLATAES